MAGTLKLLENRQGYNMYLDKYIDTKCYINSSVNNAGTLTKDFRNNDLQLGYSDSKRIISSTISNMDSGRGVLLYNSKDWQYFNSSFDEDTGSNMNSVFGRIYIATDKIIYYKLNSLLKNVTFDGSYVTVSGLTNDDTIYKVSLNGADTTSYTVTGGVITFTNSNEYNAFGNYATIIFYKTSQTITNQEVILNYKSNYKPSLTLDEYMNGVSFGSVNTTGTTVTIASGFNKLVSGMMITINELERVITNIDSDTQISINESAGNLTGATLKVIPCYKCKIIDEDFDISKNEEYIRSEHKNSKRSSKVKIKEMYNTSFRKGIMNYEEFGIINLEFENYISDSDIFRVSLISNLFSKKMILNNCSKSENKGVSISSNKNTEMISIELESFSISSLT